MNNGRMIDKLIEAFVKSFTGFILATISLTLLMTSAASMMCLIILGKSITH